VALINDDLVEMISPSGVSAIVEKYK
jgi:hypothetical protein